MIQDHIDLNSHLRELKQECEKFDISARWFVFGSYAKGEGAVSDIDIVVVLREISKSHLFRKTIEESIFMFPIDLSIMTPAEERYLDFLRTTGAREI